MIPGQAQQFFEAAAAQSGSSGYQIERSLRFESDDTAYLTRTPSTAGDVDTWTWSGWVKRSELGEHTDFFSAVQSGGNATIIQFDNNDKLDFENFVGNSDQGRRITTQYFRDTGAWYHIVAVYDSNNSTADDRIKLYVNGSQITSFTTTTNPSSGQNSIVNSEYPHYLGSDKGFNNHYFNGYLAEVHFIDGQVLAPTDFGETNDDGLWIPKAFTGTYGDGKVVQVGSPSYPSDFTTEGDKTSDQTGLSFGSWTSGSYTGAETKIFKVSDTTAFSLKVNLSGGTTDRLLWYSDNATNWTYVGNTTSLGLPYTLTGHKYYATSEGSGSSQLFASNPLFGANSFKLNFSDTTTNQALGFDSSVTVSNPDPAFGMDVVRYTGTGASQNISTLCFEPGLVWIKDMTSANSHNLSDSVRGPNLSLFSNANNVETAGSSNPYLSSFDRNGFTLGANNDVNTNGNNYVAWVWRAGGTPVANTDGSITSEVSANTTYGFSIVKYTVGSNTSQTIGHGLGAAPSLIIVKETNQANNWQVYSSVTGNTKYIYLNGASAEGTNNLWDNTSPTSSVFTIRSGGSSNFYDGKTQIAYCWTDVAGFSKISSYTGTGGALSVTGLGFKPKYLLIRSTGIGSWFIFDVERGLDNYLKAQTSGAQASASISLSFDSDGFSLNTSDSDFNGSGVTYLYAAYAARPGNNFSVNNILTDAGLTTSQQNFEVVTYTGNGSEQRIGNYKPSQNATVVGGTVSNPEYAFNGSGANWATLAATTTSTAASVDFAVNLTGITRIEAAFDTPSSSGDTRGRYNGANGGATRTGTGSGYSDIYNGSAITVTSVGFAVNQNGATGTSSDVVSRFRITDSAGTRFILDGDGSNIQFRPDFVWYKHRDGASNHGLFDSVRGATRYLASSNSNAESAVSGVTQFDNNNGFYLGSDSGGNGSGSWVAWCWKGGGDAVSNTDGSITSSVSANAQFGFSVVSYTGTGSAATVGHGLNGKVPELIIVKNRDRTYNWAVWSSPLTSTQYYLFLNNSDGQSSSTYTFWNDTAPTGSVFSLGADSGGSAGNVNQSGDDLVAYCFANVPGYQRIGSFTDTSSSQTLVLGFRPRFFMVKRIDASGDWFMFDALRDNFDDPLRANTDQTEGSVYALTPTDTGISWTGTSFANGDYIYIAIADSIGGDQDSLLDSPTNGTQSDTGVGGEVSGNYCTLNPLVDRYNIGSSGTRTFSQGNLKIVATTGDSTRSRYLFGTIGVSSGKWYYEMTADNTAGGIGVGFAPRQFADEESGISVRYNSPGTIIIDGTTYSSLASFTNGDIIGVALDLDDNTVQFYKNGVAVGSSYSVTTGYTYLPLIVIPSTGTSSTGATFNFGQRAWAHSAPSNHKALCTTHLPTPTIADSSDNFQTKTYTGTGATQSITTTDLSPDLVWTKRRDGTSSHGWFDIVRGATKWIGSNSQGAEGTYSDSLTSFDDEGFTLGADTVWNGINQSGFTYVAWCWDGGSTTVSNTDGSITSSVRANQTAGFSIVTYTGSANGTVGHGLGAAPEFIIAKSRTVTKSWICYHKDLGKDKYVLLNTTDGVQTSSGVWGSAEPTSSVFGLENSSSGGNTDGNLVAYCFAPVEGYSAFGMYVGNGLNDGVFVQTGFRVGWYMIKKVNAGGENWRIIDATRSPTNVAENRLLPNLTAAEGAQPNEVDFLSNGFKFRSADGAYNGSGSTYIFAAFASNPFQTNGGLAR